MPLIEQLCVTAECDRCGTDYESDGVVIHWPAKDGIDIWDDDWTQWQDNLWCPNCVPSCACGHGFGVHEYGDAACEECGCDVFTV